MTLVPFRLGVLRCATGYVGRRRAGVAIDIVHMLAYRMRDRTRPGETVYEVDESVDVPWRWTDALWLALPRLARLLRREVTRKPIPTRIARFTFGQFDRPYPMAGEEIESNHPQYPALKALLCHYLPEVNPRRWRLQRKDDSDYGNREMWSVTGSYWGMWTRQEQDVVTLPRRWIDQLRVEHPWVDRLFREWRHIYDGRPCAHWLDPQERTIPVMVDHYLADVRA